jgi:hypothetical protein
MALKVVPVKCPYETRQVALIALQIMLILAAVLVYFLRIYTRSHILRSIGIDDYIMGAAMVSERQHSVKDIVYARIMWLDIEVIKQHLI